MATAHARQNDAVLSPDRGLCWWWLRSPKTRPYYAAGVRDDGQIFSDGRYIGLSGGVLPVIFMHILRDLPE